MVLLDEFKPEIPVCDGPNFDPYKSTKKQS